MYLFLANFILVVHTLFLAFVVLGFLLILCGAFRRWSWIRNFWFRLIHIMGIGIVLALAWLGQVCPLTAWENHFREASGSQGYTESFIQHWLHKIIYYDFAPWVFTLAYTVFGVLVLITWLLIPPRHSSR
jgi:hypothetical protein